MKVLLISSKFYPEYSGSGFRAENTYRRLNKNYNLEFDVICNSKIFCGNKKYKFKQELFNEIFFKNNWGDRRMGQKFPHKQKENKFF